MTPTVLQLRLVCWTSYGCKVLASDNGALVREIRQAVVIVFRIIPNARNWNTDRMDANCAMNPLHHVS